MQNKRAIKWSWLSLLMLAACLIPSGPASALERNEILIGAPVSMTGILSLDGMEQIWAYEEAVKDINKSGGIFVKEFGKKLPVRLVMADDESNPSKAAAAVEKLIKLDKADLLLSTHSTPLIVPTCVTAEKYKKYYHANTCIAPVWLERKFKYSTLFTMHVPQGTDVPFQILNTIPEAQRPKRLALLMEDSLDGRGFAECFRGSAKKFGYTFALDEPWAIGAKDYSSQILKAKAMKVDGALVFGSPTDCITLVRQMKELGLNLKYLHGWKGTWTSDFWKALGKDAQYILTDGWWSEDYPYPGAKELGERFYKKFNRNSISVGVHYATARILFQAIETAGSLDSVKVKDAVVNHEFKGTVMGDVKYDQQGVAYCLSTGHQWWNGKQELVFPFFKGGWKVKVMPPWDKR